MNCEKCNKEHDGSFASGRFCSKSCSKGFSNVKIWTCKICEFTCEGKMKYLSHVKTHSVVLEWSQIRCDGTRKKRLIDERGRKCEVCLLSSWMNSEIPIELDHIDGNPSHNEKDNLRLICPNCHAQTEHYRGRNIGHHVGTERQKYHGIRKITGVGAGAREGLINPLAADYRSRSGSIPDAPIVSGSLGQW